MWLYQIYDVDYYMKNINMFDRNLTVDIGIDRYNSDTIQDLSTPVSDARALADCAQTEYGYNKDEKAIACSMKQPY